MPSRLSGFTSFIRRQGVIGLAVGFILGGAIQKVVASFANDILTPLLGVLFGRTTALAAATWEIGEVSVRWGSFTVILIDFVILASVVYWGFSAFKLDRLDRKDEQV